MALLSAFQRNDGTPEEPGVDSDWDVWVAASRTYNFCNGDRLIDWLDVHGEANGFVPDERRPKYDPRTDFRQFVMDRANKFEATVCDYLSERYSLVRIRGTSAGSRSRAAVEATWNAMLQGVPVIAQGVLWNPQ